MRSKSTDRNSKTEAKVPHAIIGTNSDFIPFVFISRESNKKRARIQMIRNNDHR